MTAAQKWRDEGRVEGRVEGRAEGRAEGQAELLLRQIEKRFGTPTPAIVARVRGATTEQIGRWAEKILTAASLSDLFGED